jgi:hypothetical protein
MTTLIPSNPQPLHINKANLDFVGELIDQSRELAAWKNFGTIGYEAYAEWVLENSLKVKVKHAHG